MSDNKFNGLVKGASLFLVGGVLGGVMTYNTIESDIINMPNSNVEQAVTNGLTEQPSETVSTNVSTPKYTPAEAINTVVSIDVTTTTQSNSPLSEIFGKDIVSKASGSGVIYSEDANGIYIITNNHVVEGADTIAIRLNDDDEPATASLIGRAPSHDLAVIYVTKDELKAKGIDDYLVAHIGNSDDLSIFDEVYAIGNAAGEGKSGTKGSISVLNKDVAVDRDTNINAIQIDAAINPGNSGGALINSDGELIGINFAKIVATNLEGMAYSIPINDVVPVVNDIIAKGSVGNPYIAGVESNPFVGIKTIGISQEDAASYNIKLDNDALIIADIVSNSPAVDAGLKKGDIISTLDGRSISSIDEFRDVINQHAIGDTVAMTVQRVNDAGELVDFSTQITFGNSALFN